MAGRKKGGRGRPTKLNPKVHQRIVAALSVGNYLETAAALAGVSSYAVRGWMLRGAKEHDRREAGKEPDDDEAAFMCFFLDAGAANAHAEEHAVAILVDAGQEHWQAALAFLERRYPKRWNHRVTVTVKDELDAALAHLEKTLPKRAFQDVLRALTRLDC